jgi:hypothetical protein
MFRWLQRVVCRILGIPGAVNLLGCRCSSTWRFRRSDRASRQPVERFRVMLMGRMVPLSTVVECHEQLRQYRRYAVHRSWCISGCLYGASYFDAPGSGSPDLGLAVLQKESDHARRRMEAGMEEIRRIAAGIRARR